MKAQGMFLSWIVVKDIEKAIKFYTEVAGLTLNEYHKEFGWAELKAAEGSTLGIAQENSHEDIKAGSNAVVTISVPDLSKALAHFKAKGAHLVGEVLQIPGHVKMQTFTDKDGNTLQLCEKLGN